MRGGRRNLHEIVDVILRGSHKCLIYSLLFPLIIILLMCILIQGFPSSSVVKNPPAQCLRHGLSPWVGKIPWRRKWQPTPVSLPGKSHGQRRLAGYSPLGHKRIGHNLAVKQQQFITEKPTTKY